jgi:predicted DNA-binding protein
MPVNPEKSKKTSIVLPLEVYEKIEKLSTNESRTISQMIGVLLKEALEKREQPK